MRVLVVGFNPTVACEIVQTLELAGYEVAIDAEVQTLRCRDDCAAIILDLELQKIDGLTLLKRWRRIGLATPIMAITSHKSRAAAIEAIDTGADDCLQTPFVADVLLARLRAILRRAAPRLSSVIVVGDVILDTRQKQVTVQGSAVHLGPLEFRLLSYLMAEPGRIVNKRELADYVYAREGALGSNVLEALITRLRKKLDANLIETRPGLGYVVRRARAPAPTEPFLSCGLKSRSIDGAPLCEWRERSEQPGLKDER